MAKTNKPNPFSRADWERLTAAQRKIADSLEEFDRAERCGVDCQQLRQIAADLATQLEAIQREYMTPAPRR